MPLIPAVLSQAFPPGTLAAVGGAVRDDLLKSTEPERSGDRRSHSPDLDLATTLLPEQTVAVLTATRIPHDATHIQYGTVTAQLPHQSIEITSTRAETYTGSRYPQTTFGVGWEDDARRRDFTMNAIYLFPDGTRFDPTHGEADLSQGLVRFIGNPAQRLEEDPLRLYRFARFCGLYGLKGWSPEVEEALKTAVPAAKTLSKAKVQRELTKLAATPHAQQVRARLAGLGVATG